MNHFVCFIAAYLVNALWQAPLLGGAGWLVSRMLKKLGPQAQHVAWVVTLGLTIVTPAFPLFHVLMGFMPNVGDGLARRSIVFISSQTNTDTNGSTVFPAALILTLFWLNFCALLYFAARLSFSLYQTWKLLRDSRPVSLATEHDEIWIRCKREFAVGNADIRSHRQVQGPVTLGLFRPVLLLPECFSDRCGSPDFLTALGHECAHIKRHDFQKNLIYEIASLAISFHPVTWMMKSKIAETREMICDAMAVKELVDPHIYAQSLLRFAAVIATTRRANSSHAIGIFDANILEERIVLIRTKKQYPSQVVKYSLLLFSILALLSAAAGAAVMAVDIKPPIKAHMAAADQTKMTDRVYSIKEVNPPKLVWAPDPVYPKSAYDAKGPFEGVCVLKLIVDSTGKPSDVQIVRSLGPDFDQSAINAVKQYRFSPATRKDVPVAVAVHIEVNFKKY